ncbi:MAG: hypothetical protein V6Z86_08585 [Hyphomicrobiales bacterium]
MSQVRTFEQTQEPQTAITGDETGSRRPAGLSAKIMLYAALAWLLFQLWYASPLPFMLDWGIVNSTQARSIHLGFAIFLAYLAYPALRRSPRHYIPIHDWILAVIAAFATLYLLVFYHQLVHRPGIVTTRDLIVGVAGIALLLEATRRALGPPSDGRGIGVCDLRLCRPLHARRDRL